MFTAERVLAYGSLLLAAVGTGYAVRKDGWLSGPAMAGISLILCDVIWILRLTSGT